MGVIEVLGGMGKNFKSLRVYFLFIWKVQVNKLSQKYLLYISRNVDY